MRKFSTPSVPEHSRAASAISEQSSVGTARNPFATPPASVFGATSAFQHGSDSSSGAKYFRSRRIRKDLDGHEPPKFKKDPEEKWLCIIPMLGVGIGIAITGVMIYLKIGRIVSHQYCSVLDDDFSSGTLNPSIWTMEQEVGGFGNGQFEQTTADPENIFIKDSMLYIKPTMQDESLITANTVINLTATGVCTSDMWSNCVASTNTTNSTIIPPAKSARINTKLGASIKYGRVEVKAKIPQGDWLWPAIWMMPKDSVYGAWPASGEIDIMESRGNNYTYSLGGNNVVSSALHWGPEPANDAYIHTTNQKPALHAQYGDQFHTYGLEWSEKYLFTFVDTRLLQVFYNTFSKPFWQQGGFPYTDANGTRLVDPWSQTGRPQTPFDQEFYLIINVAVGGQNGWFQDGADGKPWVDSSATARQDFWNAREKYLPTWTKNGQMIVDRVQMWEQC